MWVSLFGCYHLQIKGFWPGQRLEREGTTKKCLLDTDIVLDQSYQREGTQMYS